MNDRKIRQLVTAAMFAALTCVATMTLRVPTFGTNGYVNIGDTVVLLGAWLLGGLYGSLAGGIGAAMADLLSGYSHYVPGTLVIKFLSAMIAWALLSALSRRLPKMISYIISAAAAELFMMLGYFTYQCLFLGYGLAASVSIPGNLIQGATCSVLAVICIGGLHAARVPQKYFAGQY